MKHHILPIALLVLAAPAGLFAQESAFSYQGLLSDAGTRVSGKYEFRFRLYDGPSGGEQVGNAWGPTSLEVTQGLFQAYVDFGPLVWDGPRWLEIDVRTNADAVPFTTLTPRQPVAPAPRALVAQSALTAVTVPPASITGDRVAPGTLVGEHIASDQVVRSLNGLRDNLVLEAGPGLALSEQPGVLRLSSQAWGLRGNAGTEAGEEFLGTTDPAPLELRTHNLRAMLLVAFTNGNHINVIGGSPSNQVAAGAFDITIAGGGMFDTGPQWVESSYGTLGGGAGNRIRTNATFATIAGGGRNRVEGGADTSTIGGGMEHRIGLEAFRSTIAGGYQNGVGDGAYHSTIAGGWTNQLQAHVSTIGGGSENSVGVGSQFSTIAGGAGNIIEDNARTGTIAGGGRNRISARAERSTVGGGVDNWVDSGASNAVIAGGQLNWIGRDARGAVIPGGISNQVSGVHAFAAGHRARAQAPGVFAWADANDVDFVAGNSNEFAVRATGGVRLVTAVDAGGVPTAGVTLPPGGGAWSTLSDRKAKRNLDPVDAGEVLERLARLPLSTWSYHSEDPQARHLGPTAQDFRAAFGLGGDEQGISTVDADGVALAAIQGLHRLVLSQQEEITRLRLSLNALQAKVSWGPDSAPAEGAGSIP